MESQVKGTTNNNVDDCCGYCLENVEYMVDPRVLPCSHIFCLPCLQKDFIKNKILECHTCKKSIKDVEVDDLEKVEKLVLSDSPDEEGPPIYCDICKGEQELAISFCVDCGKKMCLKHDQYHDEYQQAFARHAHKKVTEEEYRASPGRYELQTCHKHKGEELKKACRNCFKVFCYGCDTDKKCPVIKGKHHEIEELSTLSRQFKSQLNKTLNSLSTKVGEVYTLEKRTTAELAQVVDKVEHMNDEVDRTLEEQINSLKEKAAVLKAQIEAYKMENTSTVGDFLEILHKKRTELSSLWKSANKNLSKRHDVEIVQTFTKTLEELKKAADSELGFCQLPIRKMLISTGEHRDLEVQIRESIPLLLELRQKEKKVSGHCSCIYSISHHNLLCGRESSLDILDGTNFQHIKTLNTSNVNGVSPHKQGYLALHWENGKNYIILYSPELVFMKLFGEFFRPTDKYSQMCTCQGKVVAMDPDEKQLNVYSERGEFMFSIKLANDKRPWGVQATNDGCVLVSDFTGGCLRKYKLVSGTTKPVWICYDLIAPVGISVNASGLIFVASYSGKKIHIISPEGKKLKELTHPELQQIKEIYDIAIDGEVASLACGSNGVLQFRMVYDALVN